MAERIAEIRDRAVFEKDVRWHWMEEWMAYVGIAPDHISQLLREIKESFLSDESIFVVEKKLQGLLQENATLMDQRLREEEDLVVSEVTPHLVPGNVLDVGAGSGRIGQQIKRAGHDVQLVDVIDMNKSELPLKVYDGTNLPFEANAYTNVLVIVTMHHCDDYLSVLREAARVADKNIVVIESIYTSEAERRSNMFYDWLWNRVVCPDVNVPFNFHTPSEWEAIFVNEGLVVHESIDLGYDSPMTPEHHWLFVLRTTATAKA